MTKDSSSPINREAWLSTLTGLLRAHFETAGYSLPFRVYVSVGWPSRNVRKTLGQCWEAATSSDGSPHIFISPRCIPARREAETQETHECRRRRGADPTR